MCITRPDILGYFVNRFESGGRATVEFVMNNLLRKVQIYRDECVSRVKAGDPVTFHDFFELTGVFSDISRAYLVVCLCAPTTEWAGFTEMSSEIKKILDEAKSLHGVTKEDDIDV